MAGPWEKYQAQPAAESAGPWTKYAKAAPAPEPTSVVPSSSSMVDANGEEAAQPYDFTHAAKTAASIGLPMAAYGAGSYLGGPIGPLVTGPAAAAGMEYLNQKLGISDGGPLSVASEALLPGALAGGMKVLKQVPRMLPGASAALQQEATQTARAIPSTHIAPPPVSADDLFAQLKQSNPTALPTPNIRQAATDLGSEEALMKESLKNPKIGKLVDDFGNTAGMTIEEFRANAKRLNKMIADSEEGEVKGALMKLKGGVQKDITSAINSGTQDAQTLRDAWKATRRELAADDLSQVIEKQGIRKVQEMQDQFNPNAVANWIKSPDQKFFRESLEPGEMEAIDKTLKELSRIPTVPVKRGQPIGSGRRIGQIAFGSGAGAAFGGPLGAAAGALIADKGSELVARALTTDTGRRFMVRMFRAAKGNFGEREAGMLGAFLSGGMNPLDAERAVSEPTSVIP